MRATLIRSQKILQGVMTFWFRPEQQIRFDAGQFIAITIPHKYVDNRGDMREFSISSSPDEELISVTSSYVEKNGSTYKKALLALQPGDEVFLGEPMGDFVLPIDKSIPLVFIGAGIGVTPYKSIVSWLHSHGERRDIRLIYSASKPEGFLFEQLWHDYPLDYKPIITRHAEGWAGLTGRLTPTKILNIANFFPVKGPIFRNVLIYLAGPQSMIEPLFDGLLAAGIPRSQLLLDYFPGY